MMDANQTIESGVLELYVYGLLTEGENREIDELARNNPEVEKEIISIEQAVLQLSSSFSPYLSPENFAKIREQIGLRQQARAVITKRRPSYVGWAAALFLLLASGALFMMWQGADQRALRIQNEKTQLEETVVDLEIKNQQTKSALDIVRDPDNRIVGLAGQSASPQSFAKVFYNQKNNAVYVDASGLPEPPQGKVYQVWALKLNPLTPTSIGLLDGFSKDRLKLFRLDAAAGAEGFGITLEPVGGSASPTMEQLYTLGTISG